MEQSLRLRISVVMLLLCALYFGCQSRVSGVSIRELTNAIEECPPSVVHIKVSLGGNQYSTGTGVLIRGERILTAAHVIQNAQGIEVIFGGRGSFPKADAARGQAVRYDPVDGLDLVVLRNLAIPPWAKPAPVAAKSPELQDNLLSVGLEHPYAVRAHSGKLIGRTADPREFYLSVLAQLGDSGGPVFNKLGELVGINRAIGENVLAHPSGLIIMSMTPGSPSPSVNTTTIDTTTYEPIAVTYVIDVTKCSLP